MNNAKNDWNKHRFTIEKIDGEYQISLSHIIKNSIDMFREKGYSKILDLGCGTGRNSLFFAQHGFEVFSSDICKESTEILKDKLYKKRISNISVHNFNFKDILFEDNFFDAVVCSTQGDGSSVLKLL